MLKQRRENYIRFNFAEIPPRISSSTCDEQNSWRGRPISFWSSEKAEVSVNFPNTNFLL